MPPRSPTDHLPDVRDGLTRLERIILHELHRTQRELRGRPVPTAMLYGRVTEHIPITEAELQAALHRLITLAAPPAPLRPSQTPLICRICPR